MTGTGKELSRKAADPLAAYGLALLERLSVDLTTRFGRGFSVSNLRQMRAFYVA